MDYPLHVKQSEKYFQINIVHVLFYAASVYEFAHSFTFNRTYTLTDHT